MWEYAIGASIIYIIYKIGKGSGYYKGLEEGKLWSYNQHKNKEFEKLEFEKNKFDIHMDQENTKLREYELRLTQKEEALRRLVENKTNNIPWIAELYSKYAVAYDEGVEQRLRDKKHPAHKAADTIKEISKSKKIILKEKVQLEYFLKYYETLFPWLVELKEAEYMEDAVVGMDTNVDGITIDEDRAKKYLTDEQYSRLSDVEKYQLALDRYLQSKMSKWQIGKMYERYIGYLYEKDGFEVHYQGIISGYEDMGRDLICTKGNYTEVVQCKYWSVHRNIHENAINQLYGTTVKYWMENRPTPEFEQISLINNHISEFNKDYQKGLIKAVFITSTTLTDTAREFAEALGVVCKEEVKLDKEYPMIKCNVNQRNNTKIYHLPFDQQYDRVRIIHEKEFYAKTVKEAEEEGFRRAMRWRGNN
jgi:hypothetical protein